MAYIYYNPNPLHKNIGDCTIRALTKALGKDWDEVYAGVSAVGYRLKDMPSANHIWGAYLRLHGFNRYIVDDNGKDIYTVEDFCKDNPDGVFILAIQGHVVCVCHGNYYDSWNSGHEIPLYYWKRGQQ